MDTNTMQKLVALERQFNELRAQNIELRNRAEAAAAQLVQRQAELSNEQNRNDAMLKQVHELQEQESRNDELDFELQKTEGERDFHRKHHIEAKKTEYLRKTAEFGLSSLKKELSFKREESESLKRWLAELDAQIDDLSAFIKKPSLDKKTDAEAENIYSQKVVELESSYRKLKEQHALLSSGYDAKRLVADVQLNGAKQEQTKALVSENEALRQKVESVRKENLLIKSEIEKTKQATRDKLAVQGSSSTGVFKFAPQEQAILDKYAGEIENLKRENAKLAKDQGPVVREFSDPNAPDLASKLQAANQDKAALEEQAQKLMEEIGFKDREIENLRLEGSDTEAVRRMVEANKKMALEIGRLQEQIRKLESFSRDSIMNSIAN